MTGWGRKRAIAIGQGIWLSLYTWDGFSAMQRAGLQNYRFV